MLEKMSFLDAMAVQAGCMYLSDLHYLNDYQRGHLAQSLEETSPQKADLRDWNDALEYITGKNTPCSSAEQAKAALLNFLRGR